MYLYLHKSTPTKSNRSSVTTLLDDPMLSQKIEYTIEYIYIVIRGQQPRFTETTNYNKATTNGGQAAGDAPIILISDRCEVEQSSLT